VALARTADALREDSDALDELARTMLQEHFANGKITTSVLASVPAAVRQRVIRFGVEAMCGVWLNRVQTLAVAALVTQWHGQGALSLPGIRVVRQDGILIFSAPGLT
jgi:tRNA(Ile)-lysidine synthase